MSSDLRFLPVFFLDNLNTVLRSDTAHCYLQQSEFGKTPCSRPLSPPLFVIRISGPFQVAVLCEKKMIKSSNLLLAYKIRFFFCITLSPFINSSISRRFQFIKKTGFILFQPYIQMHAGICTW